MPALTVLAPHEDEFAHRPADFLDGLVRDLAVVIHQGQMWVVWRLPTWREPDFPQRRDQLKLKQLQSGNTVASDED